MISGISELFIQWNKDNYYEHITGGVNIYLYGSVNPLVPECDVSLCVHIYIYIYVCVCVCVCVRVCVCVAYQRGKHSLYVSSAE